MAAPTLTARVTPVGIPLKDGFSTKIAFSLDPNVSFWEKSVQPPGYDGGDAIDFTTMHNVLFRTKTPRGLIDTTAVSCTVAYDPDVLNQIDDLINAEGSVTVHFPDGSTLTFFGYLKSFTPQNLEEGNFPEASIEIILTNWDPAANVEAAPVLVSVAGT